MLLRLMPYLLLSIPLSAYSEALPKWELGLGAVNLYLPHYLGADQNDFYAFPVPYFAYRGDLIRADRDGLRGLLFDSEKLKLRVSVGGSLPVNSEDNDAREGMDDLDLLVEMGPTLQYQLRKTDNSLLRAELPVRGAFSLGGDFFNHEGWTSNPHIMYRRDLDSWTLTSTLGMIYSDRHYHGYIYDVDLDDVTDQRSFYQAKSGLTASRFSLGARRRVGNFLISARLNYLSLNGAENEDSPLVKQDDYWSASLFFAWIFKESSERVD